ncbi:dihydrofolate reductase [Paenibacillus silviterrae]|uniref:dihydrofolate reductase n=1 Tax=Paenibacillus silviterrae TaxID=3242194 RepID=UPI002543C565|nr:dihydrofolate reductase [Paenibacillus chinjuensis]
MISYIFAMDENRGIGVDNKLPWRLPADLARFKKLTLQHTILMGRKTFDSIGRKPLPKRRNVVLTRDKSFQAEGCEVIHSIDEVVARYGGAEEEELFVIGGTEVFALLMPHADKMYVTEIAHRFPADTWFPEVDPAEWKAVLREKGVKNEDNPYDYEFVDYVRVKA